MEKILGKLSSYNILNNLIPGAAFIWLGQILGVFVVTQENIIEKLLIYYFCGMITSRVGSLTVESICIKRKIITYSSKKDYVEATKKDKQVNVLLETSNLYRTCAGMVLTLGICEIYLLVAQYCEFSNLFTTWTVLSALFILFFVSFCKQTKHIQSRIELTKEHAEK